MAEAAKAAARLAPAVGHRPHQVRVGCLHGTHDPAESKSGTHRANGEWTSPTFASEDRRVDLSGFADVFTHEGHTTDIAPTSADMPIPTAMVGLLGVQEACPHGHTGYGGSGSQ